MPVKCNTTSNWFACMCMPTRHDAAGQSHTHYLACKCAPPCENMQNCQKGQCWLVMCITYYFLGFCGVLVAFHGRATWGQHNHQWWSTMVMLSITVTVWTEYEPHCFCSVTVFASAGSTVTPNNPRLQAWLVGSEDIPCRFIHTGPGGYSHCVTRLQLPLAVWRELCNMIWWLDLWLSVLAQAHHVKVTHLHC